MKIQEFYDSQTCTLTYVVFDEQTRDALIIDPVLDYEAATGRFRTTCADILLAFVRENSLEVHALLETHAHADHLSSSAYLKEQLPRAKVGIGAQICSVQKRFKDIFNLKDLAVDGSQFDLLLEDNQEIRLGSLVVKVLHTPGHTPVCCCLLIGDALFTGDTLFMPDYGTGRCDFPAGSAEDLYTSVKERLYLFDDSLRVFVGHDYRPGDRQLKYQTTIGESKKSNIRLNDSTLREDFIRGRRQRDATLKAPLLFLPSLQININAGVFPEVEEKEKRYLKIPFTGSVSKGESEL